MNESRINSSSSRPPIRVAAPTGKASPRPRTPVYAQSESKKPELWPLGASISTSRFPDLRSVWVRLLVIKIVTATFIIIALSNGTRFLVHLVNVNPSNTWVNAVINLSNVFIAPFDGIFGNEAIRIGGGAIDLSALLALVAYPILMILIFWALDIVGFLRAD